MYNGEELKLSIFFNFCTKSKNIYSTIFKKKKSNANWRNLIKQKDITHLNFFTVNVTITVYHKIYRYPFNTKVIVIDYQKYLSPPPPSWNLSESSFLTKLIDINSIEN